MQKRFFAAWGLAWVLGLISRLIIFFFFFGLFRAESAAYGGSQARG